MPIPRVLVARIRMPRSGMRPTLATHREISVHFTCEETELAGTLYLPNGAGRHPAVVWVHGSGEQPRLNYGAVVAPLVEDGIAVFSYDKRGVGESEGGCCTSPGQYDLVAADADGAVLALRSHPEIDADRVGFYGASEAGWVVPLADARLRKPVAFTALVDGPAVTTGEEEVWSEAAGEERRRAAYRRAESRGHTTAGGGWALRLRSSALHRAAVDAGALALRRRGQVDPRPIEASRSSRG